MDRFIALYRGINVVGKNSVKMEALRAMHERLGHRDVQSYIQSGNIMFRAEGSADDAAREIANEFSKVFKFPAKVVVLDAKRLEHLVKNNPYAKFADKDAKTVHAGLCQGKPDASTLTALLTRTGGRETFVVGKGIGKGFVYLHAPDGYGTSKFATGMEKACGVPMTVRNWRTIQTLWTMVDSME